MTFKLYDPKRMYSHGTAGDPTHAKEYQDKLFKSIDFDLKILQNSTKV